MYPHLPPSRSGGPWRGREAPSLAYPRFEPLIYASAETLAQRFYAHARSGIDPATLETGADGSGARRREEESFIGDGYRLCVFLSWAELRGRDAARHGGNSRFPGLEPSLRNILDALSADRPGPPRHGEDRGGTAIGPREMREIADFMIPDGCCGVIGYDVFRDTLRRDPEGRGAARAIPRAARGLDDLPPEDSVELDRYRLMVALLIDLMEQLLPGRVDDLDRATAVRWLGALGRTGGSHWKRIDLGRVRRRLAAAAR
jgi:hypothetical protein